MGFTMPHVLILVGAAVTALALLLQIVGFATPAWITGTSIIRIQSSTITVDFNSGLWSFCNGDKCQDFDLSVDWLKAVRAFGVLGILAFVGSVVCAVLTCFFPGQKLFPMVAGVAAAAASVCIMIEFAVYAGEIQVGSLDFGYSFALTIVAFLLGIVAAVLFFMGMGKTGGAA